MSRHWPTRRLGEIFEIARGGSPRPIEQFVTTAADGLNWIKIGDATGGGKYIRSTKEKIKPEGLNKTRFVNAGDFLLTNSMSFGRPYILATDGCIHDGWLVLKPQDRSKIDQDYFYHVLSSDAIYQKFAARAGGSTVKNLNTEIVASVEIALPPLDEQRRIAAILDKADALRRKRKHALEMVDSLTRSVFIEMFGDPRKASTSWSRVPLHKLGTVKTGNTPPSENERNFGGSIPFVTPGDLESGRPVKRTLSEVGASYTKLVKPGSALVCCIGTIGKMGIARDTSAFNQQINAVEWGLDVEPRFALVALGFSKQEIIAKAISTTLPILKKSEFEKIEIIAPPTNLQIDFSRRCSQQDSILNAADRSSSLLQELFLSLQSRAFSGHL